MANIINKNYLIYSRSQEFHIVNAKNIPAVTIT